MSDGFISLHRKILDWEWYQDNNTKILFLHCLLKANWKEKQWKGNKIERGTFITSLDSLCVETGLSKQQVRTALDKLELTHEITRKPSNKNTTISITNYNSYQQANTQSNNQTTFQQHSNNIQITPTNKDNNINKGNNRVPEKSINDFDTSAEYNEYYSEFKKGLAR